MIWARLCLLLHLTLPCSVCTCFIFLTASVSTQKYLTWLLAPTFVFYIAETPTHLLSVLFLLQLLHPFPTLFIISSYTLPFGEEGHLLSFFPSGSDGKASAYHAGDLGSIPGSGKSLEGGNGNPLQYSCLENPMDRGAWQATVHGIAKSWTQLSN